MSQQFSITYVILDSMPELGVPIYSPSVRQVLCPIWGITFYERYGELREEKSRII